MSRFWFYALWTNGVTSSTKLIFWSGFCLSCSRTLRMKECRAALEAE